MFMVLTFSWYGSDIGWPVAGKSTLKIIKLLFISYSTVKYGVVQLVQWENLMLNT